MQKKSYLPVLGHQGLYLVIHLLMCNLPVLEFAPSPFIQNDELRSNNSMMVHLICIVLSNSAQVEIQLEIKMITDIILCCIKALCFIVLIITSLAS